MDEIKEKGTAECQESSGLSQYNNTSCLRNLLIKRASGIPLYKYLPAWATNLTQSWQLIKIWSYLYLHINNARKITNQTKYLQSGLEMENLGIENPKYSEQDRHGELKKKKKS